MISAFLINLGINFLSDGHREHHIQPSYFVGSCELSVCRSVDLLIQLATIFFLRNNHLMGPRTTPGKVFTWVFYRMTAHTSSRHPNNSHRVSALPLPPSLTSAMAYAGIKTHDFIKNTQIGLVLAKTCDPAPFYRRTQSNAGVPKCQLSTFLA